MSHLDHFFQATRNSWSGLVAIAKSEKAFRQELAALAIGIPLAFLVATDAWRRVALIGVVLLLMIVELLNTAIEKLSDHHARPSSDDRPDQGHGVGRGRLVAAAGRAGLAGRARRAARLICSLPRWFTVNPA